MITIAMPSRFVYFVNLIRSMCSLSPPDFWTDLSNRKREPPRTGFPFIVACYDVHTHHVGICCLLVASLPSSSALVLILIPVRAVFLHRLLLEKSKERLAIFAIFHFTDTFDRQHFAFILRLDYTHFAQCRIIENDI